MFKLCFAQVSVGQCSTVVKRVASGLSWFESWLQHLLVLILLGNVHKIGIIMVPISQGVGYYFEWIY